MPTTINGSGSADFHTALPVAEGGTGATASTGSGNVVLSASPTLTGTVNAAAITASGDIKTTHAGNTAVEAVSTGNSYATLKVKNSQQDYSAQIRTDQGQAFVIRDETAGVNRLLLSTAGTVTLSTPLPVASGGTGSATGAAAFPSGTRMLFQQTAAPTGWTKDTTAAINDGALRTVTGSASTGGTAAFTTAFTSRTPTGTNAASGSTSLSEAQMPAHKHLGGWAGVNGSATFGVGSTGTGNVNGQHGGSGANHAWTSTVGSGSSHNHAAAAFSGSAMDFAVKYYDVIIASKD